MRQPSEQIQQKTRQDKTRQVTNCSVGKKLDFLVVCNFCVYLHSFKHSIYQTVWFYIWSKTDNNSNG